MLDALVKHLIREIGLQGTLGINPGKIAALAQQFFDQQAAITPPSSHRRRSAGQFTQVLDDYYLNYLLGVLMEQDDVLLVVFEKNGEVEVRHTISKQTYDDVGLVALQDQYEDKLSIQLNLDVACKFLGDGRPKEFFSFSDLTWEILSAISSKGAQGLVSLDLSKWFNKTPKDLHYHTKKLLQQNLIAKMATTENGLHATHFVHRNYLSQSDIYQVAKGAAPTDSGASSSTQPVDAPQFPISRRLLSQLEVMEPRVRAVFEKQPRGLLRTIQVLGDDEWFLREVGYRGRIDMPIKRILKRLMQVLKMKGVIRRVNIKNTTAKDHRNTIIPAYQLISMVNGKVEEEKGEAEGLEKDMIIMSAGDLGLEEDEEKKGDVVPDVEEEQEMAVTLYDPTQVTFEEPERFFPAGGTAASITVDHQVLKYILDGGLNGRSYKDLLLNFVQTRRVIDCLIEKWHVREGAPAHLPQTTVVIVSNPFGKDGKLLIYGVDAYRQLCHIHNMPIDTTVCTATDLDEAGGFLSLRNIELWEDASQLAEWDASFPIQKQAKALLNPRSISLFLPVPPSNKAPVPKETFRAYLSQQSGFSGSVFVSGSSRAGRPAGKGKGKVSDGTPGPHAKQVARINRIIAGEEAVPVKPEEYRRLQGRAVRVGLSLPPRPITPGTGRKGKSSTATASSNQSSPAPSTPTASKKRPRKSKAEATNTDVLTESEAGPPRKTRRKSTLSNVVSASTPAFPPPPFPTSAVEHSVPSPPSLFIQAPPATSEPSSSSVPLAQPSSPAQLPDEEADNEEFLIVDTTPAGYQRPAHPPLPKRALPPSSPTKKTPAKKKIRESGSRQSKAAKPFVDPPTGDTTSTIPRVPKRAQPFSSPSHAEVHDSLPAEPPSTSQALPSPEAGPSKLPTTNDAPDVPEGPASWLNHLLEPFPTTASPNFTLDAAPPPAEDARARLRRKQAEAAEAAKANRLLVRAQREIIEMDLGEEITRTGKPLKVKVRKPARVKGAAEGEAKEAGKGAVKGGSIIPTDEKKKARQKKASEKAAAALGIDVSTLEKAVERSPSPVVKPPQHSYEAVTPYDNQLIPEITKQAGRPPGSDAQRHRTRHNDELDDVIMDIGAIISVRGSAPGYMYSWHPALKIIPGVSTTTIRNRFHKLQESQGAYIYALEQAYLRIWNTVGGTDLLPDPKNTRGDFDSIHHFKFFRKNIDKDLLRANAIVQVVGKAEAEQAPALPGHVGHMESWKLQDVPTATTDAYDFSWFYEQKRNLSDDQAEQASRNNLFLIECPAVVPRVKAETDSHAREVGITAATIKMLSTTREEDFDPRRADLVLRKSEETTTVLEGMIKEGVLARDVKDVNGRIRVSEMFHKYSEGPHTTSFFADAAEVAGAGNHDDMLIEEGFDRWPLLASDGHTASLLTLSSQSSVELETDWAQLEKLCAGALMNTKKLDDVQLEFHIEARLTGRLDKHPTCAPPPSFDLDHGPAELDLQLRDAVLASFVESNDPERGAFGMKVVEHLDRPEVGGDGVGWTSIFSLCPEVSKKEVFRLVFDLASTQPPLLFVTGYDKPRLVSSRFQSDWAQLIPRKGALITEEADSAGSEVSKVMVFPRRWIDINGDVSIGDWDGCVRLLIGHLLDRSGMTEFHLRALVAPVLDRLETSELLRHLLSTGLARRVAYPGSSLESASSFSVKDLEQMPVGWVNADEEKRLGWELNDGRWTSGIDEEKS